MSLLNISEFSIKTIRIIFLYAIFITNLYSQNSKINGTVKDSKTGSSRIPYQFWMDSDYSDKHFLNGQFDLGFRYLF